MARTALNIRNAAAALDSNGSYRALRLSGGLIVMVPAGSNINGAAVALRCFETV